MAGYIACMGERKGVHRILERKPERKEITWKIQA
jgi:hypothetical protein